MDNKMKYTIDPIFVTFVKLLYAKNYRVMEMYRNRSIESIHSKNCKTAEKVLRIIELKKPQFLSMTLQHNNKFYHGTVQASVENNNNVLQFDNTIVLYKDVYELYKEAIFLNNIELF